LLGIITRDKHGSFEVDVVGYILSRLGSRLMPETFSARRQGVQKSQIAVLVECLLDWLFSSFFAV
jgi:hypothetical protein